MNLCVDAFSAWFHVCSASDGLSVCAWPTGETWRVNLTKYTGSGIFWKIGCTERQINTLRCPIYLALLRAFDVARTYLLNSRCLCPYCRLTHLLYILTNVKPLRQSHFTVNASQNVTANIIDGFLKIFRLERINARDHSHSTPICIHK